MSLDARHYETTSFTKSFLACLCLTVLIMLLLEHWYASNIHVRYKDQEEYAKNEYEAFS